MRVTKTKSECVRKRERDSERERLGGREVARERARARAREREEKDERQRTERRGGVVRINTRHTQGEIYRNKKIKKTRGRIREITHFLCEIFSTYLHVCKFHVRTYMFVHAYIYIYVYVSY